MTDSSQPFVLIVDDNTTNLSVLSQTLKAAGYKVRLAIDGEDALTQVQRNKPEIILLDIEMPNMDGFETCRRLQADSKTQRIPVIFMTALDDTGNKVKGLSLGAVDYITKPFAEAEVLARINVHWRLKRLTDSLEEQVNERTEKLKQTQMQMFQQEKLSALGQLVAGVAHEINNPTSSIIGNVSAAQEYINDLFSLLDLYRETFPQPGTEIEAELDALDLDYIREDLPKLIKSMKDGGERIKNISQSLCTFYRKDSDTKQTFNLAQAIDSTLLMLRHRLKANEHRPAIETIIDYGQIPDLKGFPGQINQVLMNILANAIDSLDEASEHRTFEEIKVNPNCITIHNEICGEEVLIRIADNGLGMTEDVKEHIFDQGFTTKKVGQGTGLGLAIAKQIIEEKHQGKITVHSELGAGSEFIISLSINS